MTPCIRSCVRVTVFVLALAAGFAVKVEAGAHRGRPMPWAGSSGEITRTQPQGKSAVQSWSRSADPNADAASRTCTATGSQGNTTPRNQIVDRPSTGLAVTGAATEPDGESASRTCVRGGRSDRRMHLLAGDGFWPGFSTTGFTFCGAGLVTASSDRFDRAIDGRTGMRLGSAPTDGPFPVLVPRVGRSRYRSRGSVEAFRVSTSRWRAEVPATPKMVRTPFWLSHHSSPSPQP